MLSIGSQKRNYSVRIGTDEFGDTLLIPNTTREAHLHVLGRSRSGKSRFLADLIVQDITQGAGACVIDPHGELCDYLVGWLARNPLVAKTRRVHIFDPKSPEHVFSFNPLRADGPEKVFGVADLVGKALGRVYGGDPTSTPLITSTLNLIFVILATRGLPLAAAPVFLTKHLEHIRDRLISEHPDWYYRALGEEFGNMSASDFRATVSSTERRLRPFLGNPILRRLFSQTENTFDIREAMDRGDIILCNLSQKDMVLGSQELRALGIMLTSLVYGTATSRPTTPKPRPFNLYIDEVQNYVSDDVEDMLSQSAKFGLYLTLSHQHLGQLFENEKVYRAIMSGTLLKAVFAIPHSEAMVFVDEIFADQIDPEKRKEALASPHVVGHNVVRRESGSESQSQHVGQAEATSSSSATGSTAATTRGEGTSQATGQSESFMESAGDSIVQLIDAAAGIGDEYMGTTSTGVGMASGFSSMSGTSSMTAETNAYSSSKATANTIAQSTSEGRSVSAGWSEALEPIIEWFSTQSYSLEEQRYLLARQISTLSKRHGFLAAVGQGSVAFKTNDRPDLPPLPKSEAKILAEFADRSEWTLTREEVRQGERQLLDFLTLSPISVDTADDNKDPFLHVPSTPLALEPDEGDEN